MTRLIFAVILPLLTAACIDRSRVNARCEWTDEAVASAHVGDRQLESHLERDVELATELAIRYADAVHQQRFGYEAHGGLIEGGELRNRCMATLLGDIARTHSVPLDRVVAARARGRRPLIWDGMVILLFSLIYGGISWVIARRLSQRFPAGEGRAAIVAAIIAAFAASACGVQLFDLWATTLEMVRVGNDHLSGYRASWNPWDDHPLRLYVGGIFTFLTIAAVQNRRDRRLNATGHRI